MFAAAAKAIYHGGQNGGPHPDPDFVVKQLQNKLTTPHQGDSLGVVEIKNRQAAVAPTLFMEQDSLSTSDVSKWRKNMDKTPTKLHELTLRLGENGLAFSNVQEIVERTPNRQRLSLDRANRSHGNYDQSILSQAPQNFSNFAQPTLNDQSESSNHQNVISVLGFRGKLSSHELSKPNPPHPYRCTGHVGYSFEGATIYGFGPQIPTTMSMQEAISFLADRTNPGSFLGVVSDDTAIFKDVANNPKPPGIDPSIEQNVYAVNYAVTQEKLNEIKGLHNVELNYPGTTSYGFPQKHSGYENCATFPRTLGIPIPEQTGVMKNYMDALEALGEKWTPS